jgi:hypothetical protein
LDRAEQLAYAVDRPRDLTVVLAISNLGARKRKKIALMQKWRWSTRFTTLTYRELTFRISG